MNTREKAEWVLSLDFHFDGVDEEGIDFAKEVAQAYLDQQKRIQAIWDLIKESEGVAGLHLNGDMAPWSDLLEGGRFEDWRIDLPPPESE